MVNENKLRGKLGSLKMSLAQFAKLMGISRPTARKKIDGESEFTVAEALKACEILQIPTAEVSLYFLSKK